MGGRDTKYEDRSAVDGRVVRSGTMAATPSGRAAGNYYYNYIRNGHKAGGVYFVVMDARRPDGTSIRATTKFAIVK